MTPHLEQQILRSEQAKDVLDGVLKVAHAFGVWGLGFGVCGLGFGVWGLGFGVWGLGFGVWGLWFGVQGLGFGILEFWFLF